MIRNALGRFLTSNCLQTAIQVPRRCLSLQQNGSSSTINRILPSLSGFLPVPPKTVPTIIQENFGQPNLKIWRMPQRLPLPLIPLPVIQEGPTPALENPDMPKIEKQAARMIVIRRRKMKKHQLKKLRKRRKFEYRRLALKRKTIKEKNFHMELSSQIDIAKSFDAKAYVEDMIRKAKEEIVYNKPPRNPAIKRNPALRDEKGNKIFLNEHIYGKKSN